jgi:succinyl-CoA synthetase beta subunit
MDIELVAKEDPNAIKVKFIDVVKGFSEKDAAEVADSLGLEGKTRS